MSRDGLRVYHLCTRRALAEARAAGAYRPDSLEREGFVHLSDAHQVRRTARLFFAGVPDVIVLVVDPARLTSPLVYEAPSPPPGDAPATVTPPSSDERFPHCYGPIDLEAIEAVAALDEFPE